MSANERSANSLKTRLYVASDHAGLELKQALLSRLNQSDAFDVEALDFGPLSADRVDYPDFSKKVAEAVLVKEPHLRKMGLLICGSGQGMAMSANRHRGIRAALAWNEESAKLSRAHNDANILCLGARLISVDLAWRVLSVFLKEEFEGGRHVARLEKF